MATEAGVSAGLTFSPESHEYRVDGVVVPSVTAILRATGVSADFEAIARMDPQRAARIAEKRAIGSALHADIIAADEDDLDWSTVDPRVAPYLQAWVAFRGAYADLQPVLREHRVYHRTLRYAGTLDLLCRTREGALVLVDVKSGDPEAAGARYQLAGYQAALEDRTTWRVSARWSVALTPDRTVPYQVTAYEDWSDHETWRAIVTTYYAQYARRRTA